MLTKEELRNMLDSFGITYEMDSDNPKIVYADGSSHSYDEVPLPSDYFRNLELTIERGHYGRVNI